MKRSIVILIAVMGLIGASAGAATAGSNRGVEKQDIVQIFESNGDASATPYDVVGSAKLIRRGDNLKATAKISGLKIGGVYTFWWLVGEPGFALPADIGSTFVALGGSKVIGSNGKATVRMRADLGDDSIEGFGEYLALLLDLPDPVLPTDPFAPDLDRDLISAEVRIEISYHGQAADAGGDLDFWLLDFWTGDDAVCPADGAQGPPLGPQPHCPVSFVTAFPGGTP